jgi:GNAT superfamily N-acetyltransferase
MDDVPALHHVLQESMRVLGARAYTPRQVDSALRYVCVVDVMLIQDGTYFVAEVDGQIVGCGGWSRFKSLYNGHGSGSGDILDPAHDAAKIRAFFVHPDWARRGIGRALLHTCEAAARRAGYRQLELVATLPGKPLYAAVGFEAVAPIAVELPDGVRLPAFEMIKTLAPEMSPVLVPA